MAKAPGVQQQKQIIERALSDAADCLSRYLALANAHPVDFIVQDTWDRVLPDQIQRELCALTQEQLLQLPAGYNIPDSDLTQTGKEEPPLKEVTECTDNALFQTNDLESQFRKESEDVQLLSHKVRVDLSLTSAESQNMCDDKQCPSTPIDRTAIESNTAQVEQSANVQLTDGVKTNTNPEEGRQFKDVHLLSEENIRKTDKVDTCCGDLEKTEAECKLSSNDKNLNDNKLKRVGWKHSSLEGFLSEIKQCCIENLQCLKASNRHLGSWLQDGDRAGSDSELFVRAFMNEKKMHEVEIMADLCAHIFKKSSADVVIDLGSGKGYLSTHLSLHGHLPVIGIDSQAHNTSGAVQRAVKLEQRWDSLVKHEQRKMQKQTALTRSSGKSPEHGSYSAEAAVGQNATCGDHSDVNHVCGAEDGEVHLLKKPEYHTQTQPQICQTKSKSNQNVRTEPMQVSNEDLHGSDSAKLLHNDFNLSVNAKNSQTCNDMVDIVGYGNENQTNESNTEMGDSGNQTNQPTVEERGSKSGNQNNQSNTEKRDCKSDTQNNQSKATNQKSLKHVAVTMYVNPDTKLTDLVIDSAAVLDIDKPAENTRLLLTGLHTCGPLAPSMLRLFVKDDAVKAVCGVGCCYQLMQERFVDDSGFWHDPLSYQDAVGSGYSGPDQQCGDFPLSQGLLERKMSIGRVALNIASLSLPRMTQCHGELQGKTFYPRALLQAFICKKLGYVPQDLKKLRKLAKQAQDPPDYVRRALKKLNIAGCQETEDEITEFHEQHGHLETKMAAFFQLRAALAPLIETVVLLDRLVYLMEQDCVQDAFLVRVFDPVMSPRCHAIIATKKETA